MAVILLTGAVALILLGGLLVFVGLAKGNVIKLLIGIGMVSGGVAVAKAASKTTQEKLEEQDERGFDWMSDDTHGSLKEYEDEYLARQVIKYTSRNTAPKPNSAEKKESESNFCENCGNTLNPKAKFCGSLVLV